MNVFVTYLLIALATTLARNHDKQFEWI